MNKQILFLTTTRADFGKMESLMKLVDNHPKFDCRVFITGQHTLARYGYTVEHVKSSGFLNAHVYMNQFSGEPMELVLANTIGGLSRFVSENPPDLIVVHGDRVEALAGAIVGTLRNTLVAHIEGGELSGTVDGILRHSVSKMSHIHFVANEAAAIRLRQMGENPESIFVIGSPDIDAILSSNLPSLEDARSRYEIEFSNYAIVAFHSVTTELQFTKHHAEQLVAAITESDQNFVIIYPNNDPGNENIFRAYEQIRQHPRCKFFPSLRFKYFLTLLKHAVCIIGNSSAGIHEAPVYGIPTINIGTRQKDRFLHSSITNVSPEHSEILQAIDEAKNVGKFKPCHYFGSGNSSKQFIKILQGEQVWKVSKQKEFLDID